MAVATAVTGATATDRVPITVTGTSEAGLALLSNPKSGVAPLTVSFSLLPSPASATVELDFDGDGTVDFRGPSLEGQPFTYAKPGMYYPTVRVTDATGTGVAPAMVEVVDRTVLDARLQAKWGTLQDSLRRGDVERAVDLFAESSQEAYRELFTTLADVGGLAQVAADLSAITLVHIRDGAAEYELRAIQNGIEYSFHVLFVIDTDGLWRLWAF